MPEGLCLNVDFYIDSIFIHTYRRSPFGGYSQVCLGFATKRTTYEKLLVHVLGPSSCERMANSSVICTDNAGTLTQNAMSGCQISCSRYTCQINSQSGRKCPSYQRSRGRTIGIRDWNRAETSFKPFNRTSSIKQTHGLFSEAIVEGITPKFYFITIPLLSMYFVVLRSCWTVLVNLFYLMYWLRPQQMAYGIFLLL